MCLSNKKIPDLPEIPEKERTPLVNEILETCSFQKNGLDLKKERRTITSRFTIPFLFLRMIFEQLLELGIDISSGQVNRIINENKDIFYAEKVGGVLKHGFNPKMVIISDDAGQFNSFP